MTLKASRYLYFYLCKHCATWAATAGDSGSYVDCNGCGGSKAYKHRALLTSDPMHQQLWDYATQNGVAHLPIPVVGSRVCPRCDREVDARKTRYHQMFWICVDCYHAAVPPPAPLTEELKAANIAAHAERVKRDREAERTGMYPPTNTTGE